MNGPARTPRCIGCGCTIHDDGAEQTDAWLESMCPPCHETHLHSLRDWDESYDLTPSLTDRVVAVVLADSMARAKALLGERFRSQAAE